MPEDLINIDFYDIAILYADSESIKTVNGQHNRHTLKNPNFKLEFHKPLSLKFFQHSFLQATRWAHLSKMFFLKGLRQIYSAFILQLS